MGLFSDFAAWGRENRLSSEKAEQRIKNEAALELLKKEQAIKEARQKMAMETIANLERQKELSQQKIPEGQHGVVPDWGLSEKLKQYHAYGQAGLDPKDIAEAEKARFTTDAFEQAMAGINNPAQLGNLANKIDISPFRQSGQVTYNRYSGDKTYTPQGQADARKAKLEADDAELRLNTLKPLLDNPEINPLLAADIAQDKSVFKPEKVEIEGQDGKTRISYATMTPSGKPVATALTDSMTGKPLTIPVEKSKKSALAQQADDLVATGVAPDKKTALTILTSSKTDSPQAAWANEFESYRMDDTGQMERPFRDRLEKSMLGFVGKYPNQPIPNIEQMIDRSRMPEKDKEAMLAIAQEYNSKVQRAAPATAPTGEITSQSAPMQQPFYNIPGLSSQAPAPPMPNTPPPMPEPPPPEQPPLPDFGQFAETVMNNNSPKEIRTALAQQGMNASDEALGIYLTNAVNAGADKGDIDFLAQLLGLDLKLTDGG